MIRARKERNNCRFRPLVSLVEKVVHQSAVVMAINERIGESGERSSINQAGERHPSQRVEIAC